MNYKELCRIMDASGIWSRMRSCMVSHDADGLHSCLSELRAELRGGVLEGRVRPESYYAGVLDGSLLLYGTGAARTVHTNGKDYAMPVGGRGWLFTRDGRRPLSVGSVNYLSDGCYELLIRDASSSWLVYHGGVWQLSEADGKAAFGVFSDMY